MTTISHRPSFTIVIVNDHDSEHLERALCSVLDQGWPRLQTVVVNTPGSEDASWLLEQYRDELSQWILSPQEGIAEAINQGLSVASGDIVAIMPSRGILMPGVLHHLAEQMAGESAADWVVGGVMRLDERDIALGRIRATAPASLQAYLMHDSGVLPISSSFYRRTMLQGIGNLDGRLGHAYLYDLNARLLSAGHRPRVLSQTLSCVRDQATAAEPHQTLRQGMEYIEVADRFAERLPLAERYALWMNCDRRRRIHALAEAELQGTEAKRFLLGQFVRRPWWLSDEHFRQALVHGVGHPLALHDRHVSPAA